MTFTSLHRYLGDPSGPLTDDMIDRAIAHGLRDADDLDWKSELPPLGAIPNSDFPKDVAAMANSGGGTLVFGITEAQRAATGGKDTGELTEGYERGLRSAAVTAISPPVFGLEVLQLGEPGNQCVVVAIPPSVDGPHLIYKKDYFGAPIRNDADTVWMKERQIEAMYRARFDERRRSTEVLDKLYAESGAMRLPDSPAWIVAVAHSVDGAPPDLFSAARRGIREELHIEDDQYDLRLLAFHLATSLSQWGVMFLARLGAMPRTDFEAHLSRGVEDGWEHRAIDYVPLEPDSALRYLLRPDRRNNWTPAWPALYYLTLVNTYGRRQVDAALGRVLHDIS
ncbi:hypothetical protein DKT68_13305 [Micromonospora acroterricola]|uniref:Schlafen AlbA-2 domain-containing protein n=1 Tax=Micromonospora acroterricola TaxID=2202421 RepID=A0A317D247_9ACTN|nr:ATP-binding protein [Micromonospora acroterricola]PWR08968.1 hypothetical protein DKT68_13305 [Micromonospora acroterricola]